MEGEKKSPSAVKLYVLLMFLANIALGMITILVIMESLKYEETLIRENNAHTNLMKVIKDPQNKSFFGKYTGGDQEAQAALQQFVNKRAEQVGANENIRTLVPSADNKTQEALVNVRLEKISWEKLIRFLHAVEQGGRNAYTRE
ncbi:MAG: hypothetical protein N2234_10700, partial [Planctomycetota bacterium]|nr:hypothetical protein [Planctomycetota bacterium]